MSLYDELGAGEANPDQVDRDMSGELLPEGLHIARLVGHKNRDAKTSEMHGDELSFEIAAGEFAGKEIKETLWKSDNEKVRNRRIMFAHRLGLLTATKGPDGKAKYVPVEGKNEWYDASGTAVVIDVQHEEYDKTDKASGKPNGQKGKSAKIKFGGIYAMDTDDKRVVEFLRTAPKPDGGTSGSGSTRPSGGGGQPGSNGAAGAGASKGNPKNVDLSDL